MKQIVGTIRSREILARVDAQTGNDASTAIRALDAPVPNSTNHLVGKALQEEKMLLTERLLPLQ